MGAWDFIRSLFGVKGRFSLDESHIEAVKAIMSASTAETSARELALSAAAALIAGTVSKCEVKTFQGGAEHKGDEYYLWNVRPNRSENGAQFMRKLITRLCLDGEALVVFDKKRGGQAFAADSFAVKPGNAHHADEYAAVQSGQRSFAKEFPADDVLYFALSDVGVKRLTDTFYAGYKPLIASSLKHFTRSRGERGVFRVDRIPSDTTHEEYVRQLMELYMKPYFEGDNVALPLSDGQEYERLDKQGSLPDAKDTRKLIDDVFDMTALAFGIPPALLRGEKAGTGGLMESFITFCIDPICSLISREMTAKRYPREKYLEGCRIEIDTSSVKHVDLLDAATAADKLVSSGAASPNEVRKALGLPPINEKWASLHYITKNYQRIADALAAAEGGDESAKELLESDGFR